jgi:hypothetical protein
LVGNPSTGEKFDYNSQVPYAHGVGIISDELFEVSPIFLKVVLLNIFLAPPFGTFDKIL